MLSKINQNDPEQIHNNYKHTNSINNPKISKQTYLITSNSFAETNKSKKLKKCYKNKHHTREI